MTLMTATGENRFVTSASWGEYLKFLEAVGDRPTRVTYDRGRLEIMSPSAEHERIKRWMGTLLEALLMARGLDYLPGGSTTFRREDLAQGLEPDECYWIGRFEAVRDRYELDLTRDPAPDLVLEVDVSRSSLDRIELYRALKVGEVWRYRRSHIEVHRLEPDGSYRICDQSSIFPDMPMAQWIHFLEMARETSITRATRAFREYLQTLQ